jgi:hypothetical protein
MPARNSIFNDCPNESAFNAEHFGHGHVPQPSKDNDEDRDQNERGYDSNDDADKLTLHKYRPETVWKKTRSFIWRDLTKFISGFYSDQVVLEPIPDL